ncbi:MAG: sigma factor-like helix-turn-helix DNA-binding protein [Candidatus Altiarchaeota archaeon]|nr:sigma factor-like helix-turn-helix DNA-binding protein [Candidatus Altiarchaeota archaeon]
MPNAKFKYERQHLDWIAGQLEAGLPKLQVAHGFLDRFRPGYEGEVAVGTTIGFLKRNFPDGLPPVKATEAYLERAEHRYEGRKGRSLFTEYTPDHVDWIAERLAGGLGKIETAEAFVREHETENPRPSVTTVRSKIMPLFRRGEDPFEVASRYRREYKTRGEIRQGIEASQPPEVRNRVAIANALRTHKERSKTTKEMWRNMAEDVKDARVAKITTDLTPEERSERNRRGWLLRRIREDGTGIRKKKRKPPGRSILPANLESGLGFEDEHVVKITPALEDRRLDMDEGMRALRESLPGLPEKERRVVEMRLAGRSNAEIGPVVGVTPNEVNLLYVHAIQNLRKLPRIKEMTGR